MRETCQTIFINSDCGKSSLLQGYRYLQTGTDWFNRIPSRHLHVKYSAFQGYKIYKEDFILRTFDLSLAAWARCIFGFFELGLDYTTFKFTALLPFFYLSEDIFMALSEDLTFYRDTFLIEEFQRLKEQEQASRTFL